MRPLFFTAEMLMLLPVAVVRPYVGVLLWCFISFDSPQQTMYGPLADLPWALLFFAATILGCFVNGEPKRFPRGPLPWLFIAFAAAVSFSATFALAPSDIVDAKWIIVVKTFVGSLLIISLTTDRKRIEALVWMMVLSLGFYGAKGGVFAILHGGAEKTYGPPSTMITDNNHLAAALLVCLPLMNYLRIRSTHRLVRTALAGIMVLTLLCVVASYSRGALLGLGAMAGLLWFRSRNKLVMGIAGVAAIGLVIGFMPDSWWERMHSIGDYQADESATGRIDIWRASFAMAVARPFTGAGFMGPYVQGIVDRFITGVHARAVHSIYFEVIGENGFLAFFIWLSMTVTGLLGTRSIMRRARGVPELAWARDLASMAQVSIVTYLVAGAFLSLCYWDYYFALLSAVAASRALVLDATAVKATGPIRFAAPRASPSRLAWQR